MINGTLWSGDIYLPGYVSIPWTWRVKYKIHHPITVCLVGNEPYHYIDYANAILEVCSEYI